MRYELRQGIGGDVMKKPQGSAVQLLEQFARRALMGDLRDSLAAGQWAILRYLGEQKTRKSVREICEHLGEPALPVHRAISSLKRKGLIQQETTPNPSRHSLTENGRDKLREDPIWRIETALMRLAPEEQRELCRLLTILTDAQTSDLKRR